LRSLTRFLAGFAAAALALIAFAGEETVYNSGVLPEKSVLERAEPTTSGTFDGTWMYVNRDSRFALWIRTRNGTPQVKLQYQSLATPEAFETDWDGKAVYYLAGNPVNFDLKLGDANTNQIKGSWSWALVVDRSGRREMADLVLYRTGYGRTLMADFQNYRKIVTREGKDTIFKAPVNWTWMKVSKRELLWDELPF
jgi:hypothetical protein